MELEKLEKLDVAVNQKRGNTESFSQSLTSFKSPQDRRGENDKAEFELSPLSETQSPLPVSARSLALSLFVCVCKRREIIAKHFLLKSLSATQKTQTYKSDKQERNQCPVQKADLLQSIRRKKV